MFKRLMVLCMVLFALVGLVSAQDDGTINGLITVDAAEVRVGPDFAYDSIGELPLNTAVIVIGRAGDFRTRWNGQQWVQIEYGERTAWIYARLVRTSTPFNDIPPTGRMPPRDRNGRVPEEFDMSSEICSQWVGGFSLSGNLMGGDTTLTVTYPGLTGANLYSVIVISPTGFRTAFDSETTTGTIELERLPAEGGTYTWRVAPYWSNNPRRSSWQQVCLLETGGTFEKPAT
ncbi:MAG: SH3 domain-containing protein [Anaerolineae bacterium]|nr:SH3 domain-containing protein [Anaerolineae bacterium]